MSIDNLCIITPCFNDHDSLDLLLQDIARLESPILPNKIHIYIVNDSPWIPIDLDRLSASARNSVHDVNKIHAISSLVLNRNIGHQHALCVGLSQAFAEYSSDSAYILMDCDGEDSPSQIPQLIQGLYASGGFASVAARSKRRETLVFRLGYYAYKKLFRLLSGDAIDFGNFMYLLPEAAQSLVNSPYARSHLAASLIRSRLPFVRVSLDRSYRYSGHSRMGGGIALIGYGIKAISIFADRVMTRMLIACFLGLILIVSLLLLLILNYFLGVIPPIPGWTSLIILFLVLLGTFGALLTLNSLLLMPQSPLLTNFESERLLLNCTKSQVLCWDAKSNTYVETV